MTVAELMAILAEFPPSAVVAVYERDWDERLLSVVGVSLETVKDDAGYPGAFYADPKGTIGLVVLS
jgi:hypothetical protein